MKKKFSLFLSLALALVMILGVVPVQAHTFSRECTLYSAKDKYSTGDSKNKVFLASYTGAVTEVTTSNPKVATIQTVGDDDGGYLLLILKKAGKTTIHYSYNGYSITEKVTVRKYKNPVSSIKIGKTSISSSKFKTKTSYTLKYSKFAKKKSAVNIKLAKGWRLEGQGFTVLPKGATQTYGMVKNGSSIKVKGGKGYVVSFRAVNQKTQQVEDFEIIFK